MVGGFTKWDNDVSYVEKPILLENIGCEEKFIDNARTDRRDRNMLGMSKVDMSKVDTRFWVTTEAEEESEERSHIAMSYATKNWKQYRNLPKETRHLLYDLLWDNYQLPGIMEMSIEEVLAMDKIPT